MNHKQFHLNYFAQKDTRSAHNVEIWYLLAAIRGCFLNQKFIRSRDVQLIANPSQMEISGHLCTCWQLIPLEQAMKAQRESRGIALLFH
jgi:hypothetical protein